MRKIKIKNEKLFSSRPKMIISALVFILLMTGFIYLGTKEYNKDVSDNIKFTEDYKNFSKQNVFEYSSANEINSLLNKDAVIFLGSNSNKWSEDVARLINEVALENEVEKIHYYDFFSDRTNNNGSYERLTLSLQNYLYKTDTGDLELYAPTVIIVKGGQIIYYDDSTAFVRGNLEPYEYWGKTQEEDFKLLFEESIKEFKGES